MTERKLAEEKLSAQASELQRLSLRDELTGLYNRRGFLKMAARSFAEAEREGRAGAVIFVDLNGIKRINDELGHDVGDAEEQARPYRLSMSVGAAFMPGTASSLAQLLDEADAAMYAQKNARRLAGGVSIPPPA